MVTKSFTAAIEWRAPATVDDRILLTIAVGSGPGRARTPDAAERMLETADGKSAYRRRPGGD
ncbi:MAG: hypothetical protein MZW92_75595 [Comamonadaceae bacterium]|nr:hypothetical protein [Comamonadaceae bacterium]